MAAITAYRNFDLLITRAGERYKAIVTDAPAGEESILFDPPFAAGALPRLEGLVRGVTRGATRAIGVADDPGPAADLTQVGSQLFAAVFAGPVGSLLAASQASVAAEDAGLRLRLRFEADAAELALLPWETLYDQIQGHFVGLGETSPVLRYLALPRSRSALPVKPPLRVLAVLASPIGLHPLDVEREWQTIQEALADLVADGKFVLERLASPTLDALQQRLLGEPVHILHFIGHGVFDEASQAGSLAFADARGRPHLVRGDDLAKLLRNHPGLRLTYLNACQGALASGGSVFTGVAQSLVREGVPAAVAMQAEISDPGAIELARTFYTALAAGRPVDAALTQARVALSAAGSGEWAIPVLFSRSRDNRLFDIRQVLPTPDCPYPGMVPFSEAQKELFFGRDREIAEATARLRQHPFLAIIGASGSGKSSLVNAGVIPALRKSRRAGAGEWEIKTMRPSDRRTPSGQAAPMQALAELLDLTPQSPSLPLSPSPHLPTSTLLFVDQLEEAFTLAAADEAQAFLEALGALIGQPNLAILLTARADFYPELMACALWPAIKGNRLELPPLGDDELWAAIVEPANRVGVTVDEALAVRLIADASGQRGVLPLVQETLVLLWDQVAERQLGLKAYQALARDGRSGLQVAIDRRASVVYDNLPAAAQPIARRIFLRLVQFGEGRADTRRQQTAAELRASGDDPALFEQTLATLTASRLLTASGAADDPDRRLDIAHEALIAGWPRLQEWLGQRRAAEQTRRRLEAKATEWLRSGQRGGLLDEYELQEAEGWLASEDAGELGHSQALEELVLASQQALAQAAAEQEAQRQRELEQARKLAEEQRLRAEEGEQAARGLRKRFVAAMVAVLIAGIALAVAVVFGADNRTQRDRAENALVTAENALATATIAQGQAEVEAENARTAQAAAEADRAEAQKQASIARIGELAAESQSVTADTPQLGLLLATQAVKESLLLGEADRNVKAEQALLDALSAAGGMPLAKPGSQIYGLAFSEDGRWLAAQSTWDAPTRIWDMNADGAGQPRQRRIGLAVFPADDPVGIDADTPPASFGSPASSPPDAGPNEPSAGSPPPPPSIGIPSPPSVDPSSTILQGPAIPVDNSIRLTRPGDPIGPGHHAEFSPDGRFAAVYHVGDGRVRLWDMDNGLAEPVSVLLDGLASAGAFSPDSCQLATGDPSGVIRVWYLCGAYPPAAPAMWAGHAITVTAVAFSPDGRWLATAAYRRLTATATESEDVKLWSIAGNRTNSNPLVLENGTYTNHLDFSADGRWLLASAGNEHLRVWRISDLTGTERDAKVRPALIQDTDRFASSRDGRWLVSVQNNEATSTSSGGFVVTFFRLEPESQQPELVRECSFAGSAERVTVSLDGRWAAVTQESGAIVLLDAASANPCAARTVKAPSGPLVEALFSPDARWLAARAEYQQVAYLWQLPLTADQAEPLVLYGHDASISAAAFSADSRWLATGGTDGEVRLWDLANAAIGAALPVTFDKGYDPCNAGCKTVVTPDSQWIAAPYLRGDSEGIAFWEVGLQARAEPAFLCRREPDFWGLREILDIVYNAKAGVLAIWSGDVDLFDVDLRNQVCTHKETLEQNNWPWSDTTPLGFSRDGRWLVLQDTQNRAGRLWNITGDLNAGTIPCSTFPLPDGASPEGQVLLGGNLVAWGSDGSGDTWCRERILDPTGTSVASANQHWGAIGYTDSGDSGVDIWDLDFAAPRAIRRLPGLDGSGGVIAIDNSGRWFAQRESDGFSLYQLSADGIEMPPVLAQPDSTSDAAFSENGRWFAAVNVEGDIRLWDITGLGRLTPLLFQIDPGGTQTGDWAGTRVSFSPDSQWLIGYSTTGIKLWPLAAQTWIDRACQVAARPIRNSKCRLPARGVSGARDIPSRKTRSGTGRVRCDRVT